MIKNKVVSAFLLLLALQSCQSKSNAPSDQQDQKVSADSSTASKNLIGLAPLSPISKPQQEAFRLDTASLSRFECNWYLFAFGEAYRIFQKDAVRFPFECLFQDSLGNVRQLLFQSVDSMVGWRLEHPDFFGEERGDIDRVVAEGYPHATFDLIPFEHLQRIPFTDSILVTYITPFSKSDYYFKRENGRWIVFKSSHFQYSFREIQELASNRFEDFLLNFSSDITYRLQHTKFPLKDRTTNGDGETESILYRTRKEEEHYAHVQEELFFKYMTIYSNLSKSRIESKDLYLTVKHEGCACGWSHFRKTGDTWMLVETMNCSG